VAFLPHRGGAGLIGFTVALVAVEYFVLRRRSSLSLAVTCLAIAWTVGLIAFAVGAIPGRAVLTYAGFGVFALAYVLASSRADVRNGVRAGTLLLLATTCFGLVHGFGFAGFLMETGLLGSSLFVPLLGFNLGVEAGQLVDVVGTTKGKGFAGTVKRHNFRTQDNTHGNSVSHRVPGSIGQNQTPGRVFKGKRMSGHMGNVRRTAESLEVVRVDSDRNLILVKGAVPGSANGRVIVRPAVKARTTD